MEEVSVKVRIGSKDYTLKVSLGDEEVIKSAAKTLDERISNYQHNYPSLDKEDILSMVAFDCIIDMYRAKEYAEQADKNLALKIDQSNEGLNNLLAS